MASRAGGGVSSNAPTPGSICPPREANTILVDANGNDVAKVYGETKAEAREMAAYIAKCVNSFQQ